MELQVIHSILGRLRVRSLYLSKNLSILNRIDKDLTNEPGILRVQTNSIAGSILINYESKKMAKEDLIQRLSVISGMPVVGSGSQNPPSSFSGKDAIPHLAKAVQGPISQLNQGLYRLTDGYMDLRYLVPVTFALLGTIKLYRLGFTPSIPWYLFYWWSFRLFSSYSNTSN